MSKIEILSRRKNKIKIKGEYNFMANGQPSLLLPLSLNLLVQENKINLRLKSLVHKQYRISILPPFFGQLKTRAIMDK